MPYIHPALRWKCLLRNVRREPIPAAAVSCKGQCVIWEGVTSPSVEQTTRCSKCLTCQTPGLSHFGDFWMAADPQIAMALQGSPFMCVVGYLHPAACGPTVARVARGAGTGARCYRRWRSGHTVLPHSSAGGPGPECAPPPAARERWSPGGCCSCLCFSRAQIASVRWLISGKAGPPRQALSRVFPEVAGPQEYEGNDGILLANKLPPSASSEILANVNDTSFISL